MLSLLLPAPVARGDGCIRADQKLIYRYLPNCEGRQSVPAEMKNFVYRTNSEGLVGDREHLPLPAPGTVRILMLGQSDVVNINGEIGVAHSLEVALNAQKIQFRKKTLKFEVINAAVNGYSLVQTYLELTGIAYRYHPHLVVLSGSYPADALITAMHSLTAERYDAATGLVQIMGTEHSFWPLPKDWDAKLWLRYGNRSDLFRVNSKAIRFNLMKLYIFFRDARRLFAPPSFYTRTVLRYLSAMKDLSESVGAHFLFFTQLPSIPDAEKYFAQYRAMRAPYIPEWQADHILPWNTWSNADLRYFDQEVTRQVMVVNTADIQMTNKMLYAGDPHLTPEGTVFLGRRYAEKLAPLIASFLEKGQLGLNGFGLPPKGEARSHP